MSPTPASAAYARVKALKKSADGAKFSGKKPSTLLYMGVGMIALLKDGLDLAVGLIPGVVTILSLCFSFLIWMLLFLFDRSGGRHNKKMTQGLILAGVTLIEGLGFGLNYLPVETLSIFLLYILAKRAYKKAEKEGIAKERELSKAEKIALQQALMEEEEQRRQEEDILEANEVSYDTEEQTVTPRAEKLQLRENVIQPSYQMRGKAVNEERSTGKTSFSTESKPRGPIIQKEQNQRKVV